MILRYGWNGSRSTSLGPQDDARWGGGPNSPATAACPRGLAVPGSAPGQLHDVAGEGAFIPPGPVKTPRIGGDFPTDSGRFRRFRGKRWGVLEASGANWRKSSNHADFSACESLHIMILSEVVRLGIHLFGVLTCFVALRFW